MNFRPLLLAAWALTSFSFLSQAQTSDLQPILSADDLQNLVAPIALYPDPLIALILPASTVPTDVVIAERYLQAGGDQTQIEHQNWDPSVKSLAHYPEIIDQMSENLEWTNQLGAAVLAQQADVMTAIQVKRAQAQALGNLETTPQQEVIVQNQIIQIVPADPQLIYVPVYNPQVIYVQKPTPSYPFITFGAGLAMGIWISNDCDWHRHSFYVRHYSSGWHGYSHTNVNINSNNQNNYWRPNPNRPSPRPPYNPNRPGSGSPLPAYRPYGGRPNPSIPGNVSSRPGAGSNVRPGPSIPQQRPNAPQQWPNSPQPRPEGPQQRPSSKPTVQGTPTQKARPARPNNG